MFRVKEFVRGNGAVKMAEAMNAWFLTLEGSPDEYDIRQILDVRTAVLVFYEVEAVEPPA